MSLLNEIFGSKPTVPNLPTMDLGTEQKKAVENNAAVMPAAEDLVNKANLFSVDQIQKMLRAVTPGFDNIVSGTSKNIEAYLRGEIPTDVSSAVQNSGAARSLGLGMGGSGMSRNLVARDLGLTSLDLTQKGISSAESWLKTQSSLYQPSMINLSSMFVSPLQQAGFDMQEREAQFQKSWMQNQIDAMPDPVMSGINAEIMQLMNSFVGSMGGGGGGGGSGMTGYTESFSGVSGGGISQGFGDGTSSGGMSFGNNSAW